MTARTGVQVPDGIRKPDWADTGVPLIEMESKQQRTGQVPMAAVLLVPAHKTTELKLTLASAVPFWRGKDLDGIRAACKLAREVLDLAHAAVAPGVTTDDLDRVVRSPSCEHASMGR